MATVIPRNVNIDVDPTTVFEPGMFSIPELHFIVDHMGESPVVAFDEFDPDGKHLGVIRQRAEAMLAILYEREELRKYRKVEWAGFKAIKETIMRFLEWDARCREIRRRGGPSNPSMFHWDDTGKAHKFAIGADSAELVRTEILDDGSRKPFAVRLQLTPDDVLRNSLAEVMPWVAGKGADIKNDRLIWTETRGKQTGNVACPICGFAQPYQLASDKSKGVARARMARHLKTATEETARHRLLYTREYQ